MGNKIVNLFKGRGLDNELAEEAALNYESLGYVYLLKGFLHDAEINFKLSLRLFNKLSINSPDTARIYNHLGSIYSRKHNFLKALEHFKKSYSIYIGPGVKDIFQAAVMLNNIGNTYSTLLYTSYKKREFYKLRAIKSFTKALQLASVSGEYELAAKIENNISVVYFRAGAYAEAEASLRKTMQAYRKLSLKDTELAVVYHNYGALYHKTGEFRKAKAYIQKSIYLKRSLSIPNIRLFKDYRILAEIDYASGKFRGVLKHVQDGLNTITTGSINNMYEPEFIYNILYTPDLIELFKIRSMALREMYKKKKQLKYLELCFAGYRQIMLITDMLRKDYNETEVQDIFNYNLQAIFGDGLEACYELYNLTGKERYIDESLEFMERFKALSLLQSINDSEAKEFAGIPEKMLEKEKRLLREISFYQKIIANEKAGKNRKKIKEWENILFAYKREHEAFTEQLKRDYKNYYNIKYNNSVSVKELQPVLKRGEALAEYFLGVDFIYIVSITGDRVLFIQEKKNAGFEKRILGLKNMLGSGLNSSQPGLVKELYFFYNKLVKASIAGEALERLIIIPDGITGYIPFEILLSEKPAKGTVNFKELKYLVNKVSISYSYSSTLFYRDYSKGAYRNNKVIAFSPSFRGAVKGKAFTEDTLHGGLAPLKWSRIETSNIKKYFKCEVFAGSKATKVNFQKYSPGYSIIHLATHGIIDDRHPMFSKIALSPVKKSIDGGYLHTYELYNLKINASLAVLSACNTGYGKLVNGEGIMNIARGFTYAGCRSIVMSLWQVNDKSTAELMKYFYKFLAEGKRIDGALRLAKLEYLKKADKIYSHPFFWAPFITIGSSKAIS